MTQTAKEISDAKLTHAAEATWEDQKQDAINEIKAALKDSIDTGMTQVQNGEHAPLDEAYKKEMRSLV